MDAKTGAWRPLQQVVHPWRTAHTYRFVAFSCNWSNLGVRFSRKASCARISRHVSSLLMPELETL
jgi:hypothetical protein